MILQPISYGGRIAAVATATRFMLCDELERRARDDPERLWVIWLCTYDVAAGRLPGPYNDAEAAQYARGALIPTELVERAELDVDRAARALGIPADELHAARISHAA